jgi:hypothetical protein
MDKLVGGVDYSGAKDVPNETWLALGRLGGLGLEIYSLQKIGSHKLTTEIQSLHLSALGLDFPFSLPADFVDFIAAKQVHAPFQTWQELVEALVFTSFDDFVALAKDFKKESKRLTDQHYKALAQSPLHRGNPSMVQMTYQGMRFLSSLDPSKYAVMPFHDMKQDTCAVLEVFPRAMLWCLGLPDSGYKSREKKDEAKVEALRKQILTSLSELREKKGILCKDYPRLTFDNKIRSIAIDSDHALDALIACYSAAVWLSAPEVFEDPFACDDINVLLEGWIYAPVKTRQA